jgi:hypothetical protein
MSQRHSDDEPDKGDCGAGVGERPVIAEVCTVEDGFMKISPDDTLRWVHKIAEKYCGVSGFDSRPRELYIEEALVERDKLKQETERLQGRWHKLRDVCRQFKQAYKCDIDHEGCELGFAVDFVLDEMDDLENEEGQEGKTTDASDT